MERWRERENKATVIEKDYGGQRRQQAAAGIAIHKTINAAEQDKTAFREI